MSQKRRHADDDIVVRASSLHAGAARITSSPGTPGEGRGEGRVSNTDLFDLEYLLLFGLPENKTELWDGYVRYVFPFRSADMRAAHLDEWLTTLRRLRGVDRVETSTRDGHEELQLDGFRFTLHPAPIELWVPVPYKVYEELYSNGWQRELWEESVQGPAGVWGALMDHSDIRMNLWRPFWDADDRRRKGTFCGNVDVWLSDRDTLCPDFVFYNKTGRDWMIGGDYYAGPPDLAAEVHSPATRDIDLGIRKDIYARSGVPELWLLDPDHETIDVHRLAGREYELVATHGSGERFRPAVRPDVEFDATRLFETQLKRHEGDEREVDETPPQRPDWILPRDKKIGLEHLLLFGHPDRRREIWDNRCRCVLAFGSEEEATFRFAAFADEIRRWELAPSAAIEQIEPGIESLRAGRFHLIRKYRHVELWVAVCGKKYRQLLELWADHDAWDWGDRKKPPESES